MLWFNLGFSDFIKKRVCKFLLNRYLGQFFQEKLTVDQICLDLYNGKGSVSDVKLCCEVINYAILSISFMLESKQKISAENWKFYTQSKNR